MASNRSSAGISYTSEVQTNSKGNIGSGGPNERRVGKMQFSDNKTP